MTSTVASALDYLNKTGQIYFAYEKDDQVSYKEGDVTHRVAMTFIDELEKLAAKMQCPVSRCPQLKFGSARRGKQLITGIYLKRVFAKL